MAAMASEGMATRKKPVRQNVSFNSNDTSRRLGRARNRSAFDKLQNLTRTASSWADLDDDDEEHFWAQVEAARRPDTSVESHDANDTSSDSSCSESFLDDDYASDEETPLKDCTACHTVQEATVCDRFEEKFEASFQVIPVLAEVIIRNRDLWDDLRATPSRIEWCGTPASSNEMGDASLLRTSSCNALLTERRERGASSLRIRRGLYLMRAHTFNATAANSKDGILHRIPIRPGVVPKKEDQEAIQLAMLCAATARQRMHIPSKMWRSWTAEDQDKEDIIDSQDEALLAELTAGCGVTLQCIKEEIGYDQE